MTDSTLDGNSASGNGGAIAGSDTLSLTHVTLAGNSASGSGGAITSSGTLTVSASTLSGNAAGVDGGGIWNNSTLAVTNSTLSGNSAAGDGGGVYSGGTLTLVNATLFGNSAVGDGGGVYNAGSLTLTSATLTGNAAAAAGGVFTRPAGSTQLDDSVVGGNTLADGATPSDLAGAPAHGGHNLIGPGGSGGLADGVNGNIVVATAADLHLGPLAGNDGRTQTVALLPGSPAIDAGDPTLAPATDQRGLPRDARPDIGAFEVVHHLVVTTLADEDDGVADIGLGTGTSLREAIDFANQDPGPDTITFAVSGTILLDGTQLPTITDDLTITAPASGLTIDADGASRILQVSAGTTVGLSGLTLAHGSADFGGAIRNYGTLSLTSSALNGNAASHDGAGIWNGGTLAVTGSTLAGNSAAGSGGGIANVGALTLTNSTLSGNSASLGGGIINYHGTASLTNSTLAGNSVSNSGGGIWNAGTLSLTNSTLSGNSASANTFTGGGGGIWNAGLLSLASSTVSGNYGRFAAGGLVNTGTASVTNSTLYGNSSGEAGGIWNLGGLSITNSTLSGNAGQGGPGGIDNTPRLGLNTLTMNNSIVANNSTNQFSYTDPNMTGYYTGGHNLIGVLPLGPLADNGGPTRTMALPAGSPAIDAADPALAPATDQRGFYRNTSPPDIGAYEAGNLVLVTTLADEDDGSADPSLGTGTSLREAINFVDAHPGADHVTIEFAVSGTISLDGTALPAITDAVTVTAPAAGLTIDAHGASGILQVNAGATVSVSGVTFANGSADDGAAVLNYGSLTLDAATFTGNSAGHDGGAVHNDGTLTLTNSTLAGNSAGHDGGGVWNDGVLTVTGSTFADNSGLDGAGVYNDGTLTLTNSTLAGNSAGTSGGGVWNGGTLTVTYSTLSGNAAGGSGGGIAGSTAFSLNDSIVANSTSGRDIAGSYTGGHNLTGAVALGPLADNGGPTQTMALPAGSPAIDAADLAFPITVDQRGAVRDSHPDIGAYEAVIVVTTLADEDDGSIDSSLGTGTSLRDAINYANAHPGADSITFAVSGTISLDGTQLPAITDALTITGPGAGLTIDAHGASGILQVSAGANVRLDRLSLAHGSADDGGAIRNDGVLAVSNSTLAGNSAGTDGGAIWNDGTLAVTDSTLAGNSAGGSGGGAYNAGTLTLTNATLTGNSASAGGGVFTRTAASTELDDSIVGGNTLANGATPSDLAGGPASGGHNLIGPGGSGGLVGGVDGNIVVATAADLHLGSLANNSGPTQTVALLPGSPAIDAGDESLALGPSGVPLTADQRGAPRVANGTVDIGAFEVVAPIVVTTLADEDDGSADPGLGTGTSLREAIEFANQDPGPNTIIFAVSGTILLDGTQLPTITDDLTITAPASGLTIDAHGASRILQVSAGTTVGLSGLTLAHGSAYDGAAILNNGTLAVTSSALTGNAVSHDGGAIWNGGTLTLTGSTLAGNSAARLGGGIANVGTLTLTKTTLSGNTASSGGGIFDSFGTVTATDSTLAGNSVGGDGGGINNGFGKVSLTNSTLSGNSSGGSGGGIFNDGGLYGGGWLSMTNCTISSNSAFDGGGLYNDDPLGGYPADAVLTNCTLAYNSASHFGGGINDLGYLLALNCTIASNSASAAGGINDLDFVWIENCIVANNSGQDVFSTIEGNIGFFFFQGDHDLIGTNPNGSFAVDPLLGPLQDNGGPTQTMALLPGSPAIGAGASAFAVPSPSGATLVPPASAPAADQRGFARGTVPSLGAYQASDLIVVTTTADEENGAGISLRDAINLANAVPGADTIEFAVSGTISLDGTPLPAITDALTIIGPTGGVTLDAHGAGRILQVNAGATVSISGLTFANGSADDGAAVLNYGTLTLASSALIDNAATADGGAIDNAGTLTLTDSTLAANSAGTSGGAIWNDGMLTVTNSTLAGNAAGGSGGGIASGATFSLNNSIVANSTSGGDIAGGYTGGHNLTGAVALGPLADNGGPTQTMALPAGSPAIDAADPALAPATDQRGFTRDAAPDIGAYEISYLLIVTTTADEENGPGLSLRQAIDIANSAPGADTIEFAVSGTILLDGTELPTITDDLTITGPGAGLLTIDAHGASRILQVNAGVIASISGLTLAHGSADDGGAVRNDGTLTLTNSTLVGNAAGSDGGALWNDGTLTVTGSTLAGNSAGSQGGALWNDGTLMLTDSTLSGSSTGGDGGGIWNDGTLAVTDSTLSGSSAGHDGGAIWSDGTLTLTTSTLGFSTASHYAGGIWNGNGGTAAVSGSTLVHNWVFGSGFVGFGGGIWNDGTLTLTDSTLSGNACFDDGGGIWNSGMLALTNSTLYGNGANGTGGAIFNVGALSLLNSTLSGNGAVTGSGIFSPGTLTVNNSIVANNYGGDIIGAYTGGHNLVGVVALGALADNGGPTQTLALPAGSPAIDAADPALAPTTDQRGVARDSHPDIGAFEFVPGPTLTQSQDSVTAVEGSTATNTGTFDDTLGRAAVTLTASLGTVTWDAAAGTWAWSYIPAEGPSGPTAVTITATDTGGFEATTTFPLTVTDAPLSDETTATALSAIEGASTGDQVVGSFSDANPNSAPGDYTATIYWGDGGSSPAAAITQAAGVFSVHGSHTYAEEGTYHPYAVVTDNGGSTVTTSQTLVTETVADAALTDTSAAAAASATEGASTGTLTVAAFTDANSGDHHGDFTATIHWGDGSSSGTVTYSNGTYSVSGSHTYAEEGTYAVTVDVADAGGSTLTGIGKTTVAVADGALTDASAPTAASATEGASTGTLTVAAFTDANSGDHHGDFTATIHWGDGSSSGTVTYSNGTYSVSGSHTYAEEGTYAVTVDVADAGGSTLTGIGKTTVAVADAPLSDQTIATALSAIEGVSTGDQVVGSFSDANPNSAPGDYTATIYWGDGGSSPAAAITQAGGVFSVHGSHTYAEEGTYHPYAVVTDNGGSTVTTSQTLVTETVARGVPTAGVSGPGNGVPGQPRTFTFIGDDPNPTTRAAGFVYTINWGDGSALQTVARTAGNGSGVAVDHVYTAPGTYTVSVTATANGGDTSAAATASLTVQTVQMQGGTLAVGGTTGNDTIVLSPADTTGDINVSDNGKSLGNFKPTDHILVYGQSGNDTIQLASMKVKGTTYYITVPAFLYGGGTGKDTLDASGSTADNVLQGGGGTNTLTGGLGHDLLIAGLGASQLNAGNHNDILVGGWTDYDLTSSGMTYDQKLAALEAVMAEWGSADSYASRVNALLVGGGLNGLARLNTSTVHDNGEKDTLSGTPGAGAALDWFLAGLTDVFKHKDKGEVQTTIS